MSSESRPHYAGDIDPQEAWAMMKADSRAQLVDVRTQAEWSFVGLPDLSGLDRDIHRIEWQTFPTMAPNPSFVADAGQAVLRSGGTKDAPVFFICRSGARSRAAAIAMSGAGFSRAYNVAGGFEGDADRAGHRGTKNGWKAAELPWRQS
jgi:rhodanese-related sulfurtransferase